MGACSSKKDTDAADPKANKELNEPDKPNALLLEKEKAELLIQEKT